jgi:ribonuclease G
MSKEIVVNVEESQTRIAIVEDGKLAELYIENAENKRTIGNMYLGRIRKVMPSIQAAFVDIGQEQDAFLHFSDLSDNLGALVDFLDNDEPRVDKVDLPEEHGNRPDLRRGQNILVQVTKEPISNKGSRISTDLSLAGRFLVLVPLQRYVAVSRKITEEKERRRLKALASSLVPEGFGVIVRTVAEGRDAKSLDKDLKLLMERWRRAEDKLGSVEAPALVHEDVDMASSIIRDQFSDDYDRILVDHKPLFHSIRSYVRAVAPKMVDRVELHDAGAPVFEAADIQAGADRAFKDRVELPSGGYLFIERTEAMHVIDVNSGRSGRGKSQSQNSLDVNLEAARVIVRQIRLRDLGGIIVVDFIDLRDDKDRKKVYDEIKKGFKDDRAVTKVLPMSDFGLVEITRQRLRPSLTTAFSSASGDTAEEDGSNTSSGNELQRAERKVQRLEIKLEERQRELKEQERKIKELKDQSENGSADDRPDPSELQSLRDKVQHLEGEAKKARQRARKAERQARRKAEERKKQQSQQRPPATSGDGVAVDPESVINAIEQWVESHRSDRRAVTLHVHPFTAAFLHRPVPSYQTEWFMKYYVRVHIEPDASMSPLDFRFVDTRSGAVLNDA